MIRTLCVSILLFVNMSLSAQNPPAKYNHEDSDLNCSLSCKDNEMLSFNLILQRGRLDALKGMDSKDICFDEAFEQALYSIDNMDKKEKELNCCIFIKFCTESSEQEHLLYLLTWDSKHGDTCNSPTLDFNIYREDCNFIPPSMLPIMQPLGFRI